MKYSYNRLIWEGFKGGFMNPTLAGPLLSGFSSKLFVCQMKGIALPLPENKLCTECQY